MNRGPLLHITTAGLWRSALAVGSLAPPSLVTDGFVHLSKPDQVASVANRLFAGRDDLLLLVIDQDRLTAEVKWELGIPSDEASERYPHLYGPLAAASVTSVMPYRPDGEGFTEPVGLPLPADLGSRASAFDPSLAQRRAAVVLDVTGGFATLDPRVPDSYEHNSMWVTGDVDAATLRSEAERVMSALSHRRVVLERPPPPELEWDVAEERLLVLEPGANPRLPENVNAVAVTTEVMAGLWRPSWHRDLPGATDAVVDQLILREPLNDVVMRTVDLAVLDEDGVPVAGTQLRIDGATAAIDAVLTTPHARGHGYARVLVTEAIHRARSARCDCIFLWAAADDWPRHWYERLGFTDTTARWVATQEIVAT